MIELTVDQVIKHAQYRASRTGSTIYIYKKGGDWYVVPEQMRSNYENDDSYEFVQCVTPDDARESLSVLVDYSPSNIEIGDEVVIKNLTTGDTVNAFIQNITTRQVILNNKMKFKRSSGLQWGTNPEYQIIKKVVRQ